MTLPKWFISRWPLPVASVFTALTISWLVAPAGHTQMPATTTSNVALNAVLSKLKAQQDQMDDNQTKIEAQTAQLEETIRQAKIYSARSGAGPSLNHLPSRFTP